MIQSKLVPVLFFKFDNNVGLLGTLVDEFEERATNKLEELLQIKKTTSEQNVDFSVHNSQEKYANNFYMVYIDPKRIIVNENSLTEEEKSKLCQEAGIEGLGRQTRKVVKLITRYSKMWTLDDVIDADIAVKMLITRRNFFLFKDLVPDCGWKIEVFTVVAHWNLQEEHSSEVLVMIMLPRKEMLVNNEVSYFAVGGHCAVSDKALDKRSNKELMEFRHEDNIASNWILSLEHIEGQLTKKTEISWKKDANPGVGIKERIKMSSLGYYNFKGGNFYQR